MPSPVATALLYWRTARNLEPRQWVYRPLRRLQRLLPDTRTYAAPPADEGRLRTIAECVERWGPGSIEVRLVRADEVLGGVFRFLGHAERLQPVDWTTRHVSHLWSYNLHYFDYALDLAWAWRATGRREYADRFRELAESWIAATSSRTGDGWEPYALSVRITNWVYAAALLGDALDAATRGSLWTSVARQTRALTRRLEFDVLGNHLQRNYQALLVGSAPFADAESESIRRAASRALWSEMRTQVLPDGVHFERSPLYHALALHDFLHAYALCGVLDDAPPADVAPRIRAMLDAFGILSRRDGALHLFNDSAHGVGPSRAEVDQLGRLVVGRGVPSPSGALSLPDAGYYGWDDEARGERLLIDCGEPGPGCQPGHAHCDLLSFELIARGRPVVVDAGVAGYAGDPFREYVRSTRAHNTASVGGREQSEVWGVFRMARRAEVVEATLDTATGFRFSGAYRPYYDRGVTHRRVVERQEGRWVVTDRVIGARGADLRSYLHLHPDFDVRVEDGAVVASAPDLHVRIEPFGADDVRVARGETTPMQGWHCPEFGRAVPAAVVELSVRANDERAFGVVLHASG